MSAGQPTSLTTGSSAARVHGEQSVKGENPWSQYFGPTNVPMQTNAYERYSEQNYDLPEAYRGKNVYLRDTLNDLITGEGRTAYYTSNLLPWEQTDQISFAWNEFHFNEQLAGRVPHEGVSRLVTSSKRSRQDKSVRRGLAMVLEHGFMGTPDGMEMYRRNMIGIAQSVQETANHDVMSAILSTEVYDRRWEAQHGVVKTGHERVMEDEVYRYGAVQKQTNGLDLLVEDVKKKMGRYGVAADTLIVPPKLSVYMNMVRPEKTEYYLGGQLATQNLKKGGSLASFRNLGVFETRSFDVYNGEPPIDLTLRPRQVGEYYVLKADEKKIEIYDEQRDDWFAFTRAQLLGELGQMMSAQGAAEAATPALGTILPPFDDVSSRFPGGGGGSGQQQHLLSRIQDVSPLTRIAADAEQRNRQTVAPAPAHCRRRSAAVLQELVKHGWTTRPDAQGGNFCEHGFASHSLVSGRGEGFAIENVPIEYSAINIVDDAVNHSQPRILADVCVASAKKRGAVSYFVNRSPFGQFARRQVTAFARRFSGNLTRSCGDPAQLQQDLAGLFTLSSQTTEFQECFAGAGGGDARIEATADGWTGHCGLHMSYSGLQLIARHGTPRQVEAATRWVTAIDAAAGSVCALQSPAVTAFIASALPPNYFCAAGGGAGSSCCVDDAHKAWLFSVMSNTRFGHSLLPVASSGTVSAPHKSLRGDTIVCPAYALNAFGASPKGIVGGLALVNASIGLSGVTSPSQLPEVNAARWQLGTPLPGSPILDMTGLRSGAKRKLEATAQSSRQQQRRGGAVVSLDHARVHWGVSELTTSTPTAVVRSGAGAVGLVAAMYKSSGFVGPRKGDTGDEDAFRNYDEERDGPEGYPGEFDPRKAKAAGGKAATIKAAEEAFREQVKAGYRDPRSHPVDIILMRPFIEHQMHSVVMMKAGADTGKTYYGHNNVTVGDDAIRKMHYVNLTFYSKAVVKESKNISVIEDVYMAGYNGGNNADFFSSADSGSNDKTVKTHNYSSPAGRKGPSLLVGLNTPGVLEIPNPMNITGSFTAAFGDSDKKKGKHYSGCAVASVYYGLEELQKYDENQTQSAASGMFFKSQRPMNTTCFRGASYVTTDDDRRVYRPNTGHLGPTYPGVKAVRSGQNKYMLSEHQLAQESTHLK